MAVPKGSETRDHAMTGRPGGLGLPVAVRRRPAIARVFAGILAACALGAWWLLADLPGPDALVTRGSADSSKIYDRRGALLFEVLDPQAGQRTRVHLAELPEHLLLAVIAVEDAGFRSNPGIDARGLARATLQMARERRIVSGGSTITQQLARLLLLSREERASRTLRRKLREMVLALRITAAYSKDDILEMYLSEVYLGQLAYGVEAAARTYFGKPARELDLAESALLAGLIQSPATTNPLVDIDAARARQAVVLGLMFKAGFIDAPASELALAEHLRFRPEGGPLTAPHFVSWVLSRLEAERGAEALRRGGLQVLTTLDLQLQRRAEAIVGRRMAEIQRREPGKPDHRASDAALVAIDPQTGQVLAMVGSADYENAAIDGAVNVALALRQPGSAFKPITYAAAFDSERRGHAATRPPSVLGEGAEGRAPAEAFLPFTPATVLSDVPSSFQTQEHEPYRPQNYDRQWHGPITLRRALATSSNMVAVKVLDAVGVDAALDTAAALGIRSLGDRERYGLALTLGGGDVRLLELTAAYGALANGGYRVTPEPVLAVLDAAAWRSAAAGDGAGLVPLRERRSLSDAPVIAPQVAFLITDILADDGARLPAFGEASVLALSRPAAAKTGTTTDFRDNWTVGYTPDLVTGVWLGNADNSPMEHISGITGAGPIWHDFMEEALRGRPVLDFSRPEGLRRVEVCASSGLLPTVDCRRRAREWFIAGTEPRAMDGSYKAIYIEISTGLAWVEGCRGTRVRRVFRLLPPAAAEWGRAMGIPEPPRETCFGARVVAQPVSQPLARAVDPDRGPRQRPGSPSAAATAEDAAPPSGLQISQPAANTTFALSPQIPADQQRIAIAAHPEGRADVAEVTLIVDNDRVAVLRHPPYRASWTIAVGAHEARAEARTADGRTLASRPVRFWVVKAVARR